MTAPANGHFLTVAAKYGNVARLKNQIIQMDQLLAKLETRLRLSSGRLDPHWSIEPSLCATIPKIKLQFLVELLIFIG